MFICFAFLQMNTVFENIPKVSFEKDGILPKIQDLADTKKIKDGSASLAPF